MPTLSPSPDRLAGSVHAPCAVTVFGGAEFALTDVLEVEDALRRDLDASTHRTGPVTVLLRDGMTQHPVGVGPVIHVDIDLPDVIVSPVLDTPEAPCTACYDRRRAQHSRDPRATAPAPVPLIRAEGLALNPTARHVLIRMLAKALVDANSADRNPNGFDSKGDRPRSRTQIYRPGKAQYLRGDLLGFAGCHCTRTAEQSPGPDSQGDPHGR